MHQRDVQMAFLFIFKLKEAISFDQSHGFLQQGKEHLIYKLKNPHVSAYNYHEHNIYVLIHSL